jgi:hypothetical protein
MYSNLDLRCGATAVSIRQAVVREVLVGCVRVVSAETENVRNADSALSQLRAPIEVTRVPSKHYATAM